MDVPCFTVGMWYDFMDTGSIESYVGRQHHGGTHSRGKQQLLIGPWLHGSVTKASGSVGELVYPDNSIFPLNEHMIRWFDHYLKGIDPGGERDPVARYKVRATDQGRTAADWPV